jgi:signal transduction histidine kinase
MGGDGCSPQTSSLNDTPLSAQARLASDERDAALRALAGRLAHQIRNPLSAVRAACSGLLHEIEDTEQRETLELSLREIDRMLSFVAATVRMASEDNEQPVRLDPGTELADVIAVFRQSREGSATVRLGELAEAVCRLPRHRLRATLFGLIGQLTADSAVQDIVFSLARRDGWALISASVRGADPDSGDLTMGMVAPDGWVQPVGLLVAERFARSVGGRLTHSNTGTAQLLITLELPCDG